MSTGRPRQKALRLMTVRVASPRLQPIAAQPNGASTPEAAGCSSRWAILACATAWAAQPRAPPSNRGVFCRRSPAAQVCQCICAARHGGGRDEHRQVPQTDAGYRQDTHLTIVSARCDLVCAVSNRLDAGSVRFDRRAHAVVVGQPIVADPILVFGRDVVWQGPRALLGQQLNGPGRVPENSVRLATGTSRCRPTSSTFIHFNSCSDHRWPGGVSPRWATSATASVVQPRYALAGRLLLCQVGLCGRSRAALAGRAGLPGSGCFIPSTSRWATTPWPGRKLDDDGGGLVTGLQPGHGAVGRCQVNGMKRKQPARVQAASATVPLDLTVRSKP